MKIISVSLTVICSSHQNTDKDCIRETSIPKWASFSVFLPCLEQFIFIQSVTHPSDTSHPPFCIWGIQRALGERGSSVELVLGPPQARNLGLVSASSCQEN